MTLLNKTITGIAFVLTILLVSSLEIKAQDAWKAPSDVDQIENPFKGNADMAKKGKATYNKLCSICHGPKGKGDGMAGMALNPKPANFTKAIIQDQTDGAIFWKLSEGRSPMAGYKSSLSEDERWQLVTYLRTFNK